MYYYIFEQARSASQRRLNTKIKELIADTGIAGETAQPSPARSIDELTQISTSKGYSTVIAVGSDLFVNRVGSSLINQKQASDRRVVLGVIPWLAKESYFTDLIGLKNLEHAIETVKFRKLKAISLGLVEPNKYFLSPIAMTLAKTDNVNIETTDFSINVPVSDLVISRTLTLRCHDRHSSGGIVLRIWNYLLGKQQINQSESLIKHSRFNIKTPSAHPVTLEYETIAKTPIVVKKVNRALHLIVARDIINN